MKEIIAVIGGAGGIGSAIVKRFSRKNNYLIVGDIDDKKGNSLISSLGELASFIKIDVLKDDSIKVFSSELMKNNKYPNHIVSLAGWALKDEFSGIANCYSDIVDKSINLNLQSHINIVRELLPLLNQSNKKNKSITLISSINAVKSYGLPVYSSAKAGLIGFTKAIAGELGSKGIRVNVVLPGTVKTEMTLGEPKDFKRLKEGSLLNRFATTSEIAEVVYAVAKKMTCITGQVIIADCGQTVKGY